MLGRRRRWRRRRRRRQIIDFSRMPPYCIVRNILLESMYLVSRFSNIEANDILDEVENIPMDKRDVLCKGCHKKLTDSKIQCSEIKCKGGTVLTTNQRGNIITKREGANTVEANDELEEQSDAGGDTNGSNQETGGMKKLSAAEILKAAGDLTHTEYLEYKRIQSEKFDSEQY
eukprot:COSAG05_NODE_2_length_63105_cov_159.292956_37_plen_173_part_00